MNLFPGDILEIDTPRGPAYAQVTHNHPAYPEVVRILSGPRDDRPDDLEALAAAQTLFTALAPMGVAVEASSERVRRIGTAAIPAQCRRFPTFRIAIRDRYGDVIYWWLWDGDGLRYDIHLSEIEAAYPMRETLSLDGLIDRLARVST